MGRELIVLGVAFLLSGLLPLGHKILRNPFAREPAIPGFSSGGNQPRTADGHNIHLLNGFRQGHRFGQSDGLAFIAFEHTGTFHGKPQK